MNGLLKCSAKSTSINFVSSASVKLDNKGDRLVLMSERDSSMNKPFSKDCQVAIISYITHSSHLNYGATLHGYAFQTYLKEKGIESVVIDYLPKSVERDNLKYPILNNDRGRGIIKWAAVKLNWLLGFMPNIQRYKAFDRFINDNILKTDTYYTYLKLQKAERIDGKKFPIYVCESDVIWKIMSKSSIDENFFFSFPAAEGCRKVAYAPTLSSKILTGELLYKFQNLVNSFAAISAREVQGAEYLKKITGKEVECVLDPTLLLDATHYDIIAKRPREDHYLLVYTVTENDRTMVKEAIHYGREKGLRVIEISNYALNSFMGPHAVKVGASIEEWLGYIKYADEIITNSFHGFCFSVIYHKEVFLFQRNGEDYKMQNIAINLGLSERLISYKTKKIPSRSNCIDWNNVETRLNEMRKTSSEFIKREILDYCN